VTHPTTLNKLEARIRQLEEENKTLSATCNRLSESQKTLEELIATANHKQLAIEMQSIELEQIFSSCPDPIWVVRQDGIVVRANSAMLRLLGRSHDEVVGQPCRGVLDFCSHDTESCPLASAHSPRSYHEWDIERPTACDESMYYMVSTSSLVTLDGSPGIVGQFRDITMRKRAEAALAQANVALSHMARVDGLTRIPNRRTFDETLAKEWSRAAREESPLALILCDIDCFKEFNDHYGHSAGDDCLKKVATIIEGCAQRAADLTARYGGEEFAILLPQTAPEGAMRVAENVRSQVEHLALQHAASPVKPVVTMSPGVASVIPSLHVDPKTLIETADKALYRAKESGRNMAMAGDLPPDETHICF